MIKHVVQIVADGNAGGGTTAVLGLCADLSAFGYRVTVVTQPNSYAERESRRLGFEVEPFDFFTSRFDLGIAGRLANLLQRICPDVVHVHGARAANPFWQRRLRRSVYPLFYTVHGFHFQKKNFLLKKLHVYAEKNIAKRSDRVFFVSKSDLEIAKAHAILPLTYSVVYNGVDSSDIPPPSGGDKDFDVVFAARFHEQKNPLFFLKVVSALRASALRFAMVGGGELKDRVMTEADRLKILQNIEFFGELPRAETLNIVNRSRVYVLPSLWEGLPIGPIEAMFCGVPVVASDIPGTAEVVVSGDTGILISEFDENAYGAAILGILNDGDREARMSARSLQVANSIFNRSQNNSAVIKHYDSAMARGGSGY